MIKTSADFARSAFSLGAKQKASASIGVQHLLTNRSDELVLQILFDQAGEQLGTRFDLRRDAGDIVLLDRGDPQGLTPEGLHAFKAGRLAVLLDVSRLVGGQPRPVREQVWDQQQDLMRQLVAIVRVRQVQEARAPAEEGYDSRFDSKLDPEPAPDSLLQRSQRLVLARARSGSANAAQPPLLAGYGPGKNLRLDFASGIVYIDPEAEQLLRQGRAVPHPRPGDQVTAQHRTRALDQTLWDLGVAGAPLPLLDAPADWWHTRVLRTSRKPIGHLTLQPCYKDLERQLVPGAITPSDLRRRARVSVLELREFLQAALVLNLVAWQVR